MLWLPCWLAYSKGHSKGKIVSIFFLDLFYMTACPFLRCGICYHVHTNPKAENQANKQRFKCFMHWSSLPSYRYMMNCYLKCSDFQSLLMGFFFRFSIVLSHIITNTAIFWNYESKTFPFSNVSQNVYPR